MTGNKAYILDFETVVADISKVYEISFSRVFKEFKIPYDRSRLEEYIATPTDVLFSRFYKGCTCKYRDFVIMLLGEFDKSFGLAVPRAGILSRVREVSENGFRIGVLAGIPEMYVDRFLSKNSVRDCVKSLVGVEKTVIPRTEAYAVKLCMKELGASLENSILVSASDVDRRMSERSGVVCQEDF